MTYCIKGLRLRPGGQRIHDYQMLLDKLAARGMEEEGLTHYLDTFKHGMPPHGGLGIGLERLTMKLVGEDNVREIHALSERFKQTGALVGKFPGRMRGKGYVWKKV